MPTIDLEAVLVIDYTNHAGKRSFRRIVPLRLWFGFSEFHPAQVDKAWYLKAVDVDRATATEDAKPEDAERDFLVTSIHETITLGVFEGRAASDERWRQQQRAWQDAQR